MSPPEALKLLIFLTGTYLWGRAFLSRHWTSWWLLARPAGAILVGWHLMALFSLALGYLGGFDYIRPAVILFTLALLWRQRKSSIQIPVFSSSDLPVVVFCLLSAFLLSRLVTPFGQITAGGMALSGAHFIDSTWHLSLINELVRTTPPENPIYAGAVLSNYHYLVDLQLALVNIFTGISAPIIFFRLAPWIIFLSVSCLFSALCIRLTGKKITAVLGVCFFLLSSNLYYLAPRFFPAPASWPSVAWVDLYSTLGVNYPLTISLSLLCVTWLLILNLRIPSVAVIILGSTLLPVKSHTALVLLISLVIYGFFVLLRQRQAKLLLTALVSIGLAFGLAFVIIGKPSQSLLVEPFWFVRTMFTSPERLNFSQWELARQYLLAHPGYLGLIKLYAVGLFWFLFFNLGPLIFGALAAGVGSLIFIITTVATFLTLTFIYSNTAIVTIQFFYLTVFVAALGSAILLSKLPKNLALSVGVLIWTLLLPGVVYTQNQYLSASERLNISPELYRLADFLTTQPAGSLLLDPEFRNGSWFTAYSVHPAYLGDSQTLPPLGLDTGEREAFSQSVFSCTASPIKFPVSYVVALPNTCLSRNQQIREIFSNSAGVVYRVL